jgi:hypothetical protein
VSVSKRGPGGSPSHTFTYSEIEAAQAARYLFDRAIKVHLRDGTHWYFITSLYWSRSARTAVLDALRARGVPILDRVARIRHFENTDAGIERAAQMWQTAKRPHD